MQAGPVPEYNVEEGEKVELTCTADGNPPPSQFEWYHLATGEFICIPSSTLYYCAFFQLITFVDRGKSNDAVLRGR